MEQSNKDLGLDFTLGSGHNEIDFTPGTTNASPLLSLRYNTEANLAKVSIGIRALLDSGGAKIRANPKLVVLARSEASFNVLTQTRYREPRYDEDKDKVVPDGVVRVVDTGIKISLKPWVSASNEIFVEIMPDISDYLGDAYGMPKTSDRSVKTTLRVLDGQTIIIGGLIQNIVQKEEHRIPILSKLPLIGPLFRHTKETESQNEFIIFITPHLITNSDDTSKHLEPYQAREIAP